MYFLLKLFLVIILIELIIRFGVKILKRDFQWFITKDSYYPKFNEKKLEKFYLNTFDKYCGWDRKPKSSGYEILKNGQKNKFVINPDGIEVHQGLLMLKFLFLETHLPFVDMCQITKLGKVF